MCFFFFFQAEDGIRDADVTGVQTCALPISWMPPTAGRAAAGLGLPARGAACAPDAAATTEATASAVAAQKAIRGRMTRLMAGNSYLRPAGRDARCPHISISSYTFQTNLSSMPGQATQAAIQAAAVRRPPKPRGPAVQPR